MKAGIYMKKMHLILSLVLVMTLLLTLCTGCNRGRPVFEDGSIFNELIFHQKYMEIEGLDMGMSLRKLLKSKGLTEDEVLITEDSETHTTYITVNTPIYFNEAGPYPVTRLYTFKNDGLLTVSYYIRYEDAEYDTAFADAESLYNENRKTSFKEEIQGGKAYKRGCA